jgi:hypothetical protein
VNPSVQTGASLIILPGTEQQNRPERYALIEVSAGNAKAKYENGNAAATANAGKDWALQVAVEENVSYCYLSDSPATMSKSLRWLQSSHEPSYIFAS